MLPNKANHAGIPKVQAQAVVLLGISGAGKGTQAHLLVRHLAAVEPGAASFMLIKRLASQ